MTEDDREDEEPTAVDREALGRALALVRASNDPGRRRQIAQKLREDGWLEAASFASYCHQVDALGLKPWQSPPCYGECGRDPDAADLLRKLLNAGLSRWEPDPRAALAAVEARPRPAA